MLPDRQDQLDPLVTKDHPVQRGRWDPQDQLEILAHKGLQDPLDH